jgi:plasmid stabilization system protein ParE
MSFSTVLTDRALHEISSAWEWYEDKQAGLGDRFKQQVDRTIKDIKTSPEHYQQRKRNYREAMTNVFPYLIVFRVLKREKIVIISSVFHASRNPRKKYK